MIIFNYVVLIGIYNYILFIFLSCNCHLWLLLLYTQTCLTLRVKPQNKFPSAECHVIFLYIPYDSVHVPSLWSNTVSDLAQQINLEGNCLVQETNNIHQRPMYSTMRHCMHASLQWYIIQHYIIIMVKVIVISLWYKTSVFMHTFQVCMRNSHCILTFATV